MASLRAQGRSWAEIAEVLGVSLGKGTAQRASSELCGSVGEVQPAEQGVTVPPTVFPPPFGGFSVDAFNAANDGIPSGADDSLENITVPGGWTLVATYHLEWNGLGAAPPADCASTCEGANQILSVEATIVGTGAATAPTCTAGAKGYKK